jgi:glycosyltransferase involved in cell wall biosynthesis
LLVRFERSGLVVGISSNVLEKRFAAGGPDGIGTYTRELAHALRVEGVEVRHVGAPYRVGRKLVRPSEASLAFPLPLAYVTAASAAVGAGTPFTGDVERAIDVYHATDYLIPRLKSKPVVATLYDAIPLMNPAWANPRLRSLKNWLLRRAAGAADLVIAISRAAVDELEEYYRIPRQRIRVVPLGVNATWFERPSDADIRRTLQRYRLHPGYILHVGTLQPRKNLDVLVSAYEALAPALRAERQLVLVGKYGWNAESLRRRLETLTLQGRVVWLDYVHQDALHALYHAAAVFAYPSLAEGFGLPVLEALACGLPIVANDLPAIREVADPTAIFVAGSSIEGMADALARTLAVEPDDATTNSRRMHARRFDWFSCAERTLAVYEEVTATRNSHRKRS